jgi:hypothetical protein
MTEGENSWSPTIIELVTIAIDEHKSGAREELLGIIEAIENFRETLKVATGGYKAGTTLGMVAQEPVGLTKQDYANYKVNEKTEGSGDPESAYLHLTVGVSLDALLRAGEWVAKRSVPSYPGLATHKKALALTGVPNLKGTEDSVSPAIKRMLRSDETYKKEREWDEEWGEEDEQIVNFIYLVVGQVGAIESELNEELKVKRAGSVKNYAPFLSRAPFHQVRKLLTSAAQGFLSRNADALKVLIRREILDWDEEPLSQKAEAYLTDIFTWKDRSPQQKYFGGMKEAHVEETGDGLKGPPVEIRSLGTNLKPTEVKKAILEVMKASKKQWK